jgi:hypothetical protein
VGGGQRLCRELPDANRARRRLHLDSVRRNAAARSARGVAKRNEQAMKPRQLGQRFGRQPGTQVVDEHRESNRASTVHFSSDA